jgi:hypothetical protein
MLLLLLPLLTTTLSILFRVVCRLKEAQAAARDAAAQAKGMAQNAGKTD